LLRFSLGGWVPLNVVVQGNGLYNDVCFILDVATVNFPSKVLIIAPPLSCFMLGSELIIPMILY